MKRPIFTIFAFVTACGGEFNPDLSDTMTGLGTASTMTGGSTGDASTGGMDDTGTGSTADTGSTDDSGSTGDTGEPADLCEGGWDTFIVLRYDCDDCATEYRAYNPDGSGEISVGFHSANYTLNDVNPIDGRFALSKYGMGEYSQDSYVYDWFNDVETPVATMPNVDESEPRWSHQGNQLSFMHGEQNAQMGQDRLCYRVMEDGSGYQEVYYDEGLTPGHKYLEGGCTWSPNGQEMIFRSGQMAQIFKTLLGSQQMDQIHNGIPTAQTPRWSSQGIVAMQASLNGQKRNVWTMDDDGKNLLQITQHTKSIGYQVDWSPDGSQIVYTTEDEMVEDKGQVIVMDADGSNAEVILTGEGDYYGLVGWGGCP